MRLHLTKRKYHVIYIKESNSRSLVNFQTIHAATKHNRVKLFIMNSYMIVGQEDLIDIICFKNNDSFRS